MTSKKNGTYFVPVNETAVFNKISIRKSISYDSMKSTGCELETSKWKARMGRPPGPKKCFSCINENTIINIFFI